MEKKDETSVANGWDWKMWALAALMLTVAFSAGYYFREAQLSGDKIVIKDSAVNCQDFCSGKSRTGENAVPAATPTKELSAPSPSTSENASSGFLAAQGSNLYHKATCPDVNRIAGDVRLNFATEEAAQNAGYQPHECVWE